MSYPAPASSVRWCLVAREAHGMFVAIDIDGDGAQLSAHTLPRHELPEFVAARESSVSTPRIRWVWPDTAAIYPELLAVGVQVERCHDLKLSHQILAGSALVRDRAGLVEATGWSVSPEPPGYAPVDDVPALFDVTELESRPRHGGVPETPGEALAEFTRQRQALATATESGRLSLLLAAESAGALIAAELAAAGVPWDVAEHDRILEESLGPRPAAGERPTKMVAAATATRRALGDPTANLDSHPRLLRSLRAAGIETSSTSQWELAEFEHPAIEPLLEYKKLSRLMSANGWAWLDAWVREERYRPVYIPGGVVTGRWASSGGGALQLPRQLRPALRASPGWLLVSADVSQLEPRVLAAMSGDQAMSAAGAGKDLYAGIVESGAVATRQEAKLAVLGAMYGSTSGDSGRLVPRLRHAFPQAMRLVDDAATVGEHGGIVSTWLGRSSPEPNDDWHELQAAASVPNASKRDEDAARRSARERGRFTRNFIVQGTAAEWAIAWMAELRLLLARFDPLTHVSHEYETSATPPAYASGPVFSHRPHLAFFLHDEVIVHTPHEHAEHVARAVAEAAQTASNRLFAGSTVDFRLDLKITERALTD